VSGSRNPDRYIFTNLLRCANPDTLSYQHSCRLGDRHPGSFTFSFCLCFSIHYRNTLPITHHAGYTLNHDNHHCPAHNDFIAHRDHDANPKSTAGGTAPAGEDQ